jgi:hypothetical protein
MDKEPDIDHDFAPRLRDYLENTYSIKPKKGIGRAHLSLPSGADQNFLKIAR